VCGRWLLKKYAHASTISNGNISCGLASFTAGEVYPLPHRSRLTTPDGAEIRDPGILRWE